MSQPQHKISERSLNVGLDYAEGDEFSMQNGAETERVMSSSEFAVHYAGFKRVTGSVHVKTDHHCAKCGGKIAAGSDTCYFLPTSGFTDYFSLAVRGGDYECVDCVTVGQVAELRMLQNALICESGLYRVSKQVHFASLFLDPPEGAWMMMAASGNQQHMVWKTPINYSRDQFCVRIGTQLININHTRMMQGVELQKKLLQDIKVLDPKFTARSIFMPGSKKHLKLLSVDMTDYNKAITEHYSDQLGFFDELSLGERWAIALIGYSELDAPEPLPKVIPYEVSASK